MRRLILVSSVILAVLLSMAGFFWRFFYQDGRRAEVVAQIIIIPKNPDSGIGKPGDHKVVSEDYMDTQQLLIRSPAIISRAVSKHGLQNLKSFEGRDPIGTIADIGGSIVVRRVAPNGGIVEIAMRGRDTSDCIIVLNALIDAYKGYLEEMYATVDARHVELINQTRDQFRNRYEAEQAAYLDIKTKSPPGNRDGEEIKAVLTAVASKRAALLIARKETEVRLAWVEKALLDKTNRTALQLRVNEWVIRSGFDRLPGGSKQENEAVLAYQESLRQELEENKSVEYCLVRLIDSERGELGTLNAHELQVEMRRKQAETSQKLLDAIVNQIAKTEIAGEFSGYAVQIIAPPTQRNVQ
jgi:hypothetical protein